MALQWNNTLVFATVISLCLGSVRASDELGDWTDIQRHLPFSSATNVAWNDPSVLYDDSTGTMHAWVTHPKTPVFGYPVEPYHLESTDNGKSWTQPDADPAVVVGASGTYDDYAIETPSVVKFSVDGLYHMYYTAEPSASPLEWAIGHATASSARGPWTKDSNNPVLTLSDLTSLGTAIVAEPGVVEMDSKLYLYFASVKSSGEAAPMNLLYEIGLVESADGTTFTNPQVAFNQLQSDSIWPRSGNYTGFSTPAPSILNGQLYIFHGVYQAGYNPDCVSQDGTQMAVSYAVSTTGQAKGPFELASEAVFVRSNFTWSQCEIRAGNAISDPSDSTKAILFFAGQYVKSDYSTITYGVSSSKTTIDSSREDVSSAPATAASTAALIVALALSLLIG